MGQLSMNNPELQQGSLADSLIPVSFSDEPRVRQRDELSANESMRLMQPDPLELMNHQDNLAIVDSLVTIVDANGDDFIRSQLTLPQVDEMAMTIKSYLGTTPQIQTLEPRNPKGYEIFVRKLSAYIRDDDDIGTTSFAAFYDRHAYAKANGIGPREESSREYAQEAMRIVIREIQQHHGLDWNITLHGKAKRTDSGLEVFERGITESQFLVLDYVRDAISMEKSIEVPVSEKMISTAVLGDTIQKVAASASDIQTIAAGTDPLISERVEHALEEIRLLTRPTFYRGELDVPAFHKNPKAAARAISRLEALLRVIDEYDQPDQEDIIALEE